MIIQWTNKFSGEKGYVKNLNRKEEYFENTFDKSKALKVSKSSVRRTINTLNEYCSNNTYEAIEG